MGSVSAKDEIAASKEGDSRWRNGAVDWRHWWRPLRRPSTQRARSTRLSSSQGRSEAANSWSNPSRKWAAARVWNWIAYSVTELFLLNKQDKSAATSCPRAGQSNNLNHQKLHSRKPESSIRGTDLREVWEHMPPLPLHWHNVKVIVRTPESIGRERLDRQSDPHRKPVDYLLERITCVDDGTLVSSAPIPLMIISQHEELTESGILSVHFLGDGIELGRMLAQQNSLLNESRTEQTVLSGNRLDSVACSAETLLNRKIRYSVGCFSGQFMLKNSLTPRWAGDNGWQKPQPWQQLNNLSTRQCSLLRSP